MLKFINKYIEEKRESTFDSYDEEQKIKVAVCVLLLEVAYCDDEFSEEEKEKIVSLLKKNFQLSDSEAQELIDRADQEVKDSVDLWHYTNLINEKYDLNEKIKLIEMLWGMVYADDVLNKHEDYLIHKLSTLLRLDHKYFIGTKLKVKEEKK